MANLLPTFWEKNDTGPTDQGAPLSEGLYIPGLSRCSLIPMVSERSCDFFSYGNNSNGSRRYSLNFPISSPLSFSQHKHNNIIPDEWWYWNKYSSQLYGSSHNLPALIRDLKGIGNKFSLKDTKNIVTTEGILNLMNNCPVKPDIGNFLVMNTSLSDNGSLASLFHKDEAYIISAISTDLNARIEASRMDLSDTNSVPVLRSISSFLANQSIDQIFINNNTYDCITLGNSSMNLLKLNFDNEKYLVIEDKFSRPFQNNICSVAFNPICSNEVASIFSDGNLILIDLNNISKITHVNTVLSNDSSETWLTCQYGQSPYNILVADRSSAKLLDLRFRESISSRFSPSMEPTLFNNDEEIYCMKPSGISSYYCFLATDKYVCLLDMRQNLKPITVTPHLLKCPPSYIDNVILPDGEEVILGCQVNGDLCSVAYEWTGTGTFKSSYPLSYNIHPFQTKGTVQLPTSRDTLNELQSHGYCYDPLIQCRFTKPLSGLNALMIKNSVYILTQTCEGDVFCCLAAGTKDEDDVGNKNWKLMSQAELKVSLDWSNRICNETIPELIYTHKFQIDINKLVSQDPEVNKKKKESKKLKIRNFYKDHSIKADLSNLLSYNDVMNNDTVDPLTDKLKQLFREFEDSKKGPFQIPSQNDTTLDLGSLFEI